MDLSEQCKEETGLTTEELCKAEPLESVLQQVRERERRLHAVCWSVSLYSVCVSYGPVLGDVLDILVCNILNSNYKSHNSGSYVSIREEVFGIAHLDGFLNGLLCGLGVGRKAQTLCSR